VCYFALFQLPSLFYFFALYSSLFPFTFPYTSLLSYFVSLPNLSSLRIVFIPTYVMAGETLFLTLRKEYEQGDLEMNAEGMFGPKGDDEFLGGWRTLNTVDHQKLCLPAHMCAVSD
jgi:hypothetical protein